MQRKWTWWQGSGWGRGGVAHHQRLDQDVLDEFEVVALQLLALGARSLRFLVGVEAEELRLVFELALLQHCGTRTHTHTHVQ